MNIFIHTYVYIRMIFPDPGQSVHDSAACQDRRGLASLSAILLGFSVHDIHGAEHFSQPSD